jgi:cytochrome c oxidase assembly factor CtaG
MEPGAIAAVAVAVLSTAAMGRSASSGRLRPRHWISFASILLGCVGWWWATDSSFAHHAMRSLSAHMVDHVVLMFLVPVALIYGGATRMWWWALAASPRRGVLRAWYQWRPRRAAPGATGPIAATVTLNAVMIVSHTPVVFDAAMIHPDLMRWVMEPAFVASGLWFFHYLVASPPRRVLTGLRVQFAMVVATMFSMLVLAMSMSIFTDAPWYRRAGLAMGSPAGFTLHAQELAGGILWICGDFWAVPLVAVIVWRLVRRDGSLLTALDRQWSSGT